MTDALLGERRVTVPTTPYLPERRHTPGSARRQIRTLVVLEQPLFAEALRVALVDRGGCDVVGCGSDLGSALDLATRTRPDAILLDVDSERHDPVAVIESLRARVPRAAVLALSGSGDSDLLSRVMTAGAAGFLSVQSDMAELVSAVTDAAGGKVVLSGRRLEALVRHLTQQAAPRETRGPGGRLTERESEVLQMLVHGASTAQIAAALLVSTHTARTHVQNVLVKLDVHSRLEAAAYAVRHGLVVS